MSTDIKLLPLPESDCQPNALRWLFPVDQRERVQDYARANVAHATAPLQAEIEALRAEVGRAWKAEDEWRRVANTNGGRAERLAEALREMREYVTAALQAEREAFAGHEDCSDIPGIEADLHKIDAMLRDQEQGRDKDHAHQPPSAPVGVVEALSELVDLMQGVIDGEYTPDSFTLQPARAALAQQPAAVDEGWRQKAAEWLEAKAVEQEANNQRWPDHAAAYKEWRDRPGVLRYLAAKVLNRE